MVRVGLMALLLLVAGCSAGDGSEPSETTGASEELQVMSISSEEPGQGPQRPRAVLAPSASTLSEAIGANVPESGSGTYLAAYWGEKPTGGYTMSVRSARLEGDRVTVRLSLKEPPRDAIVTQALTYPYAVAVIRDLSPAGKAFSFADERGRELDWPVRRAGG
ncbi:MAG TPA: protease complex subunit PrcB family protein [Rubrobacteraceae bacterium]|nr:protease complex subunit PrcB family protein [Rubrobacteraceae bacterium]